MRQNRYKIRRSGNDGDQDDALTLAVRALEADMHVEGWDRPAALALIHRDQQTLRLTLVKTAGVFVNPQRTQFDQPNATNLDVALVRMVNALTAGSVPEPLVEPLARCGHLFLGYVLVTEAWILLHDVPPARRREYQAYLAAGGRIADHPDRREARVAFASVSGDADEPVRTVTLLRERGGGPPALDPGTDPDQISDGRYVDLVTALLSATHHHLNAGPPRV